MKLTEARPCAPNHDQGILGKRLKHTKLGMIRIPNTASFDAYHSVKTSQSTGSSWDGLRKTLSVITEESAREESVGPLR